MNFEIESTSRPQTNFQGASMLPLGELGLALIQEWWVGENKVHPLVLLLVNCILDISLLRFQRRTRFATPLLMCLELSSCQTLSPTP